MAQVDEVVFVDQINAGLERLYKLKGVEYDGAFKERCEENGFDDNESIEEEMASPMDESQLADDDFLEDLCPWIKTEGPERAQEIFDILIKCYKDKNAFSNPAELEVLEICQDDFDLSQEDVDRAKKIAQDQAPEIFNAGFSNDEVLCMMMAVNLKTKKNYMLFLVDMFLREAIYNHYEGRKEVFETAEWGQNNKHIQDLKNISVKGAKDKNAGDIATAAVKSYLHRVAPKVMLKSTCRIKGSLENVAGYIHETVNYVYVMAKTMGTCPFQYDSVYAFQEKMEDDNKSDDEFDDDDDDDGNDDNDEKGDADNSSKLGDVQKLLTDNKLVHVVDAWKVGTGNRALDQSVKQLGIDLGKKNYPRNNRFISIVDFRKMENGDDPKLFVFNPQDGADTIHNNPSALNFFHNSKKSVLPDPDASDDESMTQKLTASSQGPQITLSFHVEAEDSMRCYFYVNGQCTRFMPADLKMLLPLFFEDSKDNKDFATGKDIDRMIKDMQPKLKDAAFEAFLKKFKVECPVSKKL